MPRRTKIELRLAMMKRRLELIQKAMKEEQASLVQARKELGVQARKELGLSKKKALPKKKGARRAATK